jgi:TIR domain-containing protein
MTRKPEEDYEYDVALSFAGEDRAVAEALASLLREDGVRVFYDRYEQAQLWGKDLYQHLTTVYRDKAKYCIVFASARYADKLWARYELRQAQARAFRENREYLLLLRLDDTDLPGVNPTVCYVDLREHDIASVRKLLLSKLFGNDVEDEDLAELTWHGDIVDFRGEQVASFWPKKLEDAQRKTTYLVEVPRIRRGEEKHKWPGEMCHDCSALPGEYHVPGCDVEECPVCGSQALGCRCILE